MAKKDLRIQRALFVIGRLLAGEQTTVLQHSDRCSAQYSNKIYSPY